MNDTRMFVVCRHYVDELKRARKEVACVSAGELAKRMGISRSTAKKNLEMACRLGYIQAYDFIHVNGQTATAYIPVKAGQ